MVLKPGFLLRGIAVSVLLIFSSGVCAQTAVASKGVLDLRNYPFHSAGTVSLKGEWNFYWHALLTSVKNDSAEHQYFNLPGLWDGYNFKGQRLNEDGYASFHLKLLLPPEKRIYSIEIPYIYTAYKMYVDSFLVADNGRVGSDAKTHIPQFLPKVANFQSSNGEADIIIQVSNFSDRKGGIWSVPRIGTSEKILTARSKNLALEFFTIGALILIGLYQIGLYFIRKEITSSLFFGIFCLLMGLNSLFVGSVFVQTIFPKMSWNWITRIEYITVYLMPLIFLFFINGLFPGYTKKWVIKILTFFTLLACILIVLTTKKFFGILLDVLPLPLFIIAVTALVAIFRAIKGKEHGSRNALIGIIIFMAFIVNEILFGLEYISTGNYLKYGLFIFVTIQSLNIAYIFSKAFEDVKDLTTNLRLTNVSIRRFVPEGLLNFLGKPDIKTVQLGDHKRAEMSIVFVDIRSFTTLSETMTPQENFEFINSYLGLISPVVRSNHGFVDKYIGDAIMALFPGKTEDAIHTAFEILLVLKEYNKTRAADNLPPIRVGISLHTGTVMLGTVGENERMDTTVISDAVNLAARLEGMAKLYDVQVVTTSGTIESLQPPLNFYWRPLQKGRVKGRMEAVSLIEIFNAETDPDAAQKIQIKEQYEKAMQFYHYGKLAEALEIFSAISLELPGDKATRNYIRLCNQYLENGLPENWNGVESFH